ncbi:MAG: pyrroline-5-carboxylate reductase [Lachnospiraceae bacterium]|nr:pyrroline-5-carboxylate reductase [Lachnospiraceae bacterium]
MNTVGFIGCGNMGGALIRATAKVEYAKHIRVADKIRERAESLAYDTGAVVSTAAEVAGSCGYFFLGVKPQGMEELFDEIRDVMKERTDRFVVITMAAGVPIERIRKLADIPDLPIIRIMPNLPVAADEGMIVYTPDLVTEEETEVFLRILANAGKLVRVTEEQMDAATGLSGSGPGFVCYFIEALVNGGMKCGFSKEQATELAIQTVKGTALLLQQKGLDPKDLREAVCSPHGTTLAGLSALQEGSFYQDAEAAVVRAYHRAKEL